MIIEITVGRRAFGRPKRTREPAVKNLRVETIARNVYKSNTKPGDGWVGYNYKTVQRNQGGNVRRGRVTLTKCFARHLKRKEEFKRGDACVDDDRLRGVARPRNEPTKPRMVQWEGETWRGSEMAIADSGESVSKGRETAMGPNAGSTVQGVTCASGEVGGVGCSE